MSASCCGQDAQFDGVSAAFKRALWIVIAINGAMFIVEMAAGAFAGRRRCRRTPSISSAIRPLTPSASTSSAWPCTSARRRHSSRGSALRPWGYGYLDRPLIKFSSSACRPRQSWAVSGCWRFWQTLQASSFSCDSRTATRTFAPSGSAAATTPSEMWPSSGRQPVSILPGLRGQTLLSPLSWPVCSSGRPRRLSCVRRGEKCNIVPFPRRASEVG